MPREISRESVLEFFRDNPRPVSMREMARSMGLKSPDSRRLKKVVRELIKDGELVRTRRGLYAQSREMELVTGYFEAHRDGYGFVVPDRPGERDVFIPPRHTHSAMEGDRVVASVLSRRTRTGRVVRVLERSQKRIAGTLDTSMGTRFVRPRNPSISFDIHIPSDASMGARHGQPVLVEIESYPTAKRPAMGRVVRLIEKPVDARSEVEHIIEEYGLPKRFPTRVSTEAKESTLKRPGKREDLRELRTVTIDGESAKDFDDAVSIARSPEGYTLWVHIADVSHYVLPGTRLDDEARARATSVYFPGMVIPMLPKPLSEDACSLMPNKPRAAFTAEMGFDRNGNRKSARFFKSLIESDERMTYTSVAKIIVDRDPEEMEKYSAIVGEFELMAELAALLREKRMARGSLDFDLPEPEILLDIRGNPENVIRAERNGAHMLIEDFMIAANEAVASFLENQNAPCVFRIHEEPDPRKVEEVMRVASVPVTRGRGVSPGAIRDISARVKGTTTEEAVNYMILRAMKQARYSEENIGHFGLASESYCHFTSPIRRYPDLMVHRILGEVISAGGLTERKAAAYEESLPEAAVHCSRRERLAMEAERDVLDAMRVWFMRDKVGQEFPGIITGVTPRGMRIRLDEFFVEGFIALSDLLDDYYMFDEDTLSLTGKHTRRSFSFGGRVKVRVDRVDLEERRIIFGVAEGEAQRPL